MSDLSTKKMLTAYIEGSSQKPGFFTSFFTDVVFHNSEKVELDVLRNGNRIAPVLTTLGVGGHRIESKKISNNDWAPPVYGVEFGLSAFDAMKRSIGANPYEDVNFLKNIQDQFRAKMPECEQMIRRGVELQCAQVLRNGTLALPDSAGNVGFELDFEAKSSHKLFGVGADWDLTSGTNRIGDVALAANKVHEDSGLTPKYMIAGPLAMDAFQKDADVQGQSRMDGTKIGEQVPPNNQLRNGGTYHGRVSAGQHVLEMWSTKGFYEAYPAGARTKYLGDWEVIILGENASLTLTYGGIPRIAPIDPRLSALAIGRANSEAGKFDMTTNAWFSLDGNYLHGYVGARPLAVPKSIDGFASINTKVS